MRAVAARGFQLDWSAILTGSDPNTDAFERQIKDAFNDSFADTLLALIINGQLLAAFIQRKHDRLAGVKVKSEPALGFAEEADVFTPDDALDFWQKLLDLTDEQIEAFKNGLGAVNVDSVAIADRVSKALAKQLIDLHTETIREGTPIGEFVKRARDLMPDASRNLLEGEYRTKLTQAYGGARHELIQSRRDTFPFTQFFAIIDARTTWYICLPMGTAGPNGRGYIAASDDPLWIKWRPPNHFGGCRSDLSPISYLEARRMKILDANGNKIAITGSNPNRPFGDPPKFATEPGTGRIRRVEPQEGFGG